MTGNGPLSESDKVDGFLVDGHNGEEGQDKSAKFQPAEMFVKEDDGKGDRENDRHPLDQCRHGDARFLNGSGGQVEADDKKQSEDQIISEPGCTGHVRRKGPLDMWVKQGAQQ